MKHLRKFNEDIDDIDDRHNISPDFMGLAQGYPIENTTGEEENSLISDDGDVHDVLSGSYDIASDLEGYRNIRYALKVNEDELPDDAKTLFSDIDSTIAQIRPELREKILKLYTILTGDKIS